MPLTKEPWELYPTIWKSKTAFFTYLRGHIRQIWSRYPAKLEWKKKQGVTPPPDYTGRAKKLCKCYYCRQFFPISSTEVDHAQMAGACNSWETAYQFLHNLLDCSAEWRIACRPCHKIKSYAERMGIGFDEASIEKKVIVFSKLPSEDQKKFLSDLGFSGATKKERATKYRIFLNENKGWG